MYKSVCFVKAVHITCLEWQTVINAKGLIIFHVIRAVSDLQFNVWWHHHHVVNHRMQAIKQINPAYFGNVHLPSSREFLISNEKQLQFTQLEYNLHSNPKLPYAYCLSQIANENGNASTIYVSHIAFNTPHTFDTVSDQVWQLDTQRKSSQNAQLTMGLKAASNLLRSWFEISGEENNL